MILLISLLVRYRDTIFKDNESLDHKRTATSQRSFSRSWNDGICISCDIGPNVPVNETLYDDITKADDGRLVCCVKLEGDEMLKEV